MWELNLALVEPIVQEVPSRYGQSVGKTAALLSLLIGLGSAVLWSRNGGVQHSAEPVVTMGWKHRSMQLGRQPHMQVGTQQRRPWYPMQPARALRHTDPAASDAPAEYELSGVRSSSDSSKSIHRRDVALATALAAAFFMQSPEPALADFCKDCSYQGKSSPDMFDPMKYARAIKKSASNPGRGFEKKEREEAEKAKARAEKG
eukprot:gnl/TRDRNA2_/TRDRNA2_202467_c0_seq1.p1 gnl/TRDRNA2_/TRDRNA2_202467_c0~~gnl/TRDRNA2_/TRDRNA2_202467_c0_seq1.p1  ORF type:complete len:203 (+),score=32.44 gnl/TRDRNA2_/TRDRNA2_202467_c0_seq1:125-733(+)